MAFISCSDWIKSHSRAEAYLQILIDDGKIAPAQADWLVKNIIIDEEGTKYPSDDDPDSCAFEIWCDIKSIPGHFYVPNKKT